MFVKDSLFCVRDNVSESLSFFSLAPSKGAYVRFVLPMIRVPLKDVEPCEVVAYPCHEKGFTLEAFSWDCYKYPETQMQSLDPLHLSDEEKKQIIANSKKE